MPRIASAMESAAVADRSVWKEPPTLSSMVRKPSDPSPNRRSDSAVRNARWFAACASRPFAKLLARSKVSA